MHFFPYIIWGLLWKALHKKHLSKLELKKLSEDSMHLPSWEQEIWSWPCFPFYNGCQETPSKSWNQPLLTIVNYWGIYFLPVCLDFILFLYLCNSDISWCLQASGSASSFSPNEPRLISLSGCHQKHNSKHFGKFLTTDIYRMKEPEGKPRSDNTHHLGMSPTCDINPFLFLSQSLPSV